MEFQNIWCEKSRVAVAKKACRGRCQLGVMLSEVEASPRWLCAVNVGYRWSALRRFFTAFRMALYSVIAREHSDRGNLTLSMSS